MMPAVVIDTDKIPPLELRILGATFYKAVMDFYEDPENMRRFEAWQQERNRESAQEVNS